MKKQYEESIYDGYLERLDSEIIWDENRSRHLHKKVMQDMKRLNVRTRMKKLFVYTSTAMALLILTIFSYDLVDKNKELQMADPKTNEELHMQQVANENKKYRTAFKQIQIGDPITFNGKTSMIISKEATIPIDLKEVIPNITDLSSISYSTALTNVEVFYSYGNDGNYLMIKPKPTISSIDEVIKEKLAYKKANTKELNISGKKAVLWENKEGLAPELFLVTANYIYSVEYGYIHQPDSKVEPLIQLAEQIQFHE